jgi:hypothetical protein
MKPEAAWLWDFGKFYTEAWIEGGELSGGEGKPETRREKLESRT